ncbi:response regulator [Corynebacterium terpenotabidum]|uniref:Two-component system response regulator n=1 Tax=Corynebacterium terpenotabidum Y-11 TaxID=1200352 RepID=S4XBT4_9CORY|nr:response regulator transcription factor [Corynebacterium terpenotabidum]AGP29919.1 two-component system response regulator [Corynebacterium terpenotabidum Y-11]
MTTTPAAGTVRLLLVDDDPLVLSTLRLYFSTPPAASIEVVGEASDGATALELLTTLNPDVLMTDIHMPGMDGVQLLKHVRELEHPPVFIAMTALDEDETMLSILSLGGAGYILKSSRPEFIIDTVHQALAGGTVVSPQPASRLVRHLPGTGDTAVTEQPPVIDAGTLDQFARLSASEETVLKLICAGLSNAEIARETGRSTSAVKKSVSSLLAKFGTESRIQLAVSAVEAGFHPGT